MAAHDHLGHRGAGNGAGSLQAWGAGIPEGLVGQG
jgi:hypothetical protein